MQENLKKNECMCGCVFLNNSCELYQCENWTKLHTQTVYVKFYILSYILLVCYLYIICMLFEDLYIYIGSSHVLCNYHKQTLNYCSYGKLS